MQAEKTQQAILKGVEDFDTNKLKHTETQEKIILPDKEGLCYIYNKIHPKNAKFRLKFCNLKIIYLLKLYCTTFSSAIATEKVQQNLIEGIEGFDQKKLKHAETQEKNPLPTKEGNLFKHKSS